MSTQSQSGAPRSLSVFLCHASEDKVVVHDLYKRLKRCAIDPWLDEKKLVPGQDWDWEIQKAVRNSDVVIICLSQNFLLKEGYGWKEVKVALDTAEGKPKGTIFVIPLLLVDCALPKELEHLQRVDYFETGWFEQLIAALEHRRESLSGRVNITPIRYKSSRRPRPSHQQNLVAPVVTPSLLPSNSPLQHNARWHIRGKALAAMMSVLLAVIIVVSTILITKVFNTPDSPKLLSPLQAQEFYDHVTSQYPLFDDPLNGQNFNVNRWDENPACVFAQGAYHVYTFAQTLPQCFTEKFNLSNFVFQAKMTIVKGNGGGLSFRADKASDLKAYRFFVGNDDTHYDLVMSKSLAIPTALANGTSSAIMPGSQKAYLVSVIAQGSFIYLYLNGQFLRAATDNTYTSGKIGLFALNWNGVQGEVAFSDVKVWEI